MSRVLRLKTVVISTDFDLFLGEIDGKPLKILKNIVKNSYFESFQGPKKAPWPSRRESWGGASTKSACPSSQGRVGSRNPPF